MHLTLLARGAPPIQRAFIGAFLISVSSIAAPQAAVVISANSTTNVSCSAGVCKPTARDGVLNVSELAGMLANSDVRISTGHRAKDIALDAPLSWTSGHTLTLDSYRSIFFNSSLAVAGTGGLSIATNEGDANGDFSFGENGHVDLWDKRDRLFINGAPYLLVSNLGQLARVIAKTPSGNFALIRNYNAANDGTYGAAPISTTFSGIFEGLGHRIANLTIDQTTDGGDVGLFADTNGGVLRDIRLANANVTVTGSAGSVGALVGSSGSVYYPQPAALANDIVKARVSAPDNAMVGGLAGSSSGSIINSASAGSVAGGRAAGGLVGFSFDAFVFYSHSSAIVHGSASNSDVGGLAGDQSGAIVFQSYATGSVTGSVAGGLIGYSGTDRVQDSFATGSVTAADNGFAGGLIGLYNSGGNTRLIANAYAMGSVSAGANGIAGGLLGLAASATASTSYSTGLVSVGRSGYAGGFVGSAGGDTFQFSYWDTQTSGQAQGTDAGDVSGLTGMTTAQLKAGLPSGFDHKIWHEHATINNGFPYLRDNPPPD